MITAGSLAVGAPPHPVPPVASVVANINGVANNPPGSVPPVASIVANGVVNNPTASVLPIASLAHLSSLAVDGPTTLAGSLGASEQSTRSSSSASGSGSSSKKKAKKTKVPKSVLSKGKFDESRFVRDADRRHKVMVEILASGIIIVYMVKANVEEEPFLHYDYNYFKENAQRLRELGFVAIMNRRGVNGDTYLPQTTGGRYPWRILVAVVGEQNSTTQKCMQLANGVVAHLNTHANTACYRYPTLFRFGRNLTQPGILRTPDVYLLDSDVLAMMDAAYVNHTLRDLATFDAIIIKWWSDLDYGRTVMEAYVQVNPQPANGGNESDTTSDVEDDDMPALLGEPNHEPNNNNPPL
jgi:hypothetical protein